MKVVYDDRQEADWVDRHGISAARLDSALPECVCVCVLVRLFSSVAHTWLDSLLKYTLLNSFVALLFHCTSVSLCVYLLNNPLGANLSPEIS